VHGVGGVVGKIFKWIKFYKLSNTFIKILGCLLTPLFAENQVATMSGGSAIKGGWIDQNVNL
jgi:hypothetical protein